LGPEGEAREILHRQIVQRGLEHNGCILLHAAGAELQGRAVIMLGPSGSGKTTLQTDMAAALGANLLGGGRTYYDPDGGILPFPGKFTIKLGLAENRAHFSPLLSRVSRSTLEASPSREVASLLGVRVSSRAPLSVLLFPQLGGAGGWQPLHDEAKVFELLESECLTPNDPKWPNWLGAFAAPPDSLVQSQLRGASRKPAFSVEVPLQPRGLTREFFQPLLDALSPSRTRPRKSS
jgi:hypothetical protein